ncbi:MAG: hypothetical protein ACOX5R_16155 [bacterium]|jgi:hypothetical protein
MKTITSTTFALLIVLTGIGYVLYTTNLQKIPLSSLLEMSLNQENRTPEMDKQVLEVLVGFPFDRKNNVNWRYDVPEDCGDIPRDKRRFIEFLRRRANIPASMTDKQIFEDWDRSYWGEY